MDEDTKEQNDDQVELDIVNNISEAEKSINKDLHQEDNDSNQEQNSEPNIENEEDVQSNQIEEQEEVKLEEKEEIIVEEKIWEPKPASSQNTGGMPLNMFEMGFGEMKIHQPSSQPKEEDSPTIEEEEYQPPVLPM